MQKVQYIGGPWDGHESEAKGLNYSERSMAGLPGSPTQRSGEKHVAIYFGQPAGDGYVFRFRQLIPARSWPDGAVVDEIFKQWQGV